MYEALRREMGGGALPGLPAAENRFGWATAARWRAALAATIGAEAAEAFFRRWVAAATLPAEALPPPGPFSAILEDPALGGLLRDLLRALIVLQP